MAMSGDTDTHVGGQHISGVPWAMRALEYFLNSTERDDMTVDGRFGQRIRSLRLAHRLRLEDVATAVNGRLEAEGSRRITVSYLSKIETGRLGPPSVPVILHLAALLDANSDDLLALAGKAHPDLVRLVVDSVAARAFLRQACERDLVDAEWTELTRHLPERIPIVTPLRELDERTVAVELLGITLLVRYAPTSSGWPYYHVSAEQSGRRVAGQMLNYADHCHTLDFPNPPAWLADAVPDDGVHGMFIEEREDRRRRHRGSGLHRTPARCADATAPLDRTAQ